MREFFKGWRRKVGCVALVIAGGFTGIWVRSISFGDQLMISRPDALHRLSCGSGTLGWEKYWNADGTDRYDPRTEIARTLTWYSYRITTPLKISTDPERSDEYQVKRYGFEFYKSHWPDQSARGWFVPVWCFTCPLALLSGYLLLGKPRPPKHHDRLAEG